LGSSCFLFFNVIFYPNAKPRTNSAMDNTKIFPESEVAYRVCCAGAPNEENG